MKNLRNTLKMLAIAIALFFNLQSLSAQGGYICGTDYCVENNTNCTITVDIIFYCNNVPCNASSPVTIPSKSTYCMQWTCGSSCVSANCDVSVTLLDVGGYAVSTPNTVSGANPGPIVPGVPAGPAMNCFDYGSQIPSMKWTSTVCWIGFQFKQRCWVPLAVAPSFA